MRSCPSQFRSRGKRPYSTDGQRTTSQTKSWSPAVRRKTEFQISHRRTLRKMRKPSRGLVAALSLICLLSISAFGQSGALTGAGSTFVNPLMSKSSRESHTLHPNVQINYQSIGSGGGRQQFLAKTVAFGASDAPDRRTSRAGWRCGKRGPHSGHSGRSCHRL